MSHSQLAYCTRNKVLFLMGLFITLSAASAYADHRRGGVTFYKDVHFRGRSETFFNDVSNLRGSRIGNDQISSLAVAPGCSVTLYKHAHFRGPSMKVRGELRDMGGTYVDNDEVSSFTIRCRGGHRPDYDRPYGNRPYPDRDDYGYQTGPGNYGGGGYGSGGYGGGYGSGGYGGGGYGKREVTVFADANFRGRCESFRYDDPDLRDNLIRQDTMSSVDVPRGCRVFLYEDVFYRGRVTVLTEDHRNLRYSGVGNDEVSSIRIECR